MLTSRYFRKLFSALFILVVASVFLFKFSDYVQRYLNDDYAHLSNNKVVRHPRFDVDYSKPVLVRPDVRGLPGDGGFFLWNF